jgi:ABC-type oligopeptide transport system substrate-binding subunit
MELPKKTISKHRKNNEKHYANPGVKAAWKNIQEEEQRREAERKLENKLKWIPILFYIIVVVVAFLLGLAIGN